MHSHYLGVILMALQACGGVATASAVVGRDDSPDASKLGGNIKSTSKLAASNDGGDSNTVVAYSDGQCEKPLDKKDPAGKDIQSVFKITDEFPKATFFDAQNWNPAKSSATSPSGGWEVWFSVKPPKQGCRTIIMTPYSQSRPPPDGAPPGNEVINVGGQGCYFARLQDGKPLMMSTCCGTEQCQNASLGLADLGGDPKKGKPPTRRDNPVEEEIAARSKAPEAPVSGSVAARANALANRYLYPGPKEIADCSFKPGEPFTQAGPQVVLTGFQDCPTSPCQFAKAEAKQFSTTYTFSVTDTITTELGITAGVQFSAEPFGVGVQSHVDLSAKISNAVAIATGHDTMNGNTTTFTNTQSNVIGNSAAMTFTPTLTCWTGPMDCGQPKPNPAHVCTPVNNGGNVEQSGDYGSIVKG